MWVSFWGDEHVLESDRGGRTFWERIKYHYVVRLKVINFMLCEYNLNFLKLFLPILRPEDRANLVTASQNHAAVAVVTRGREVHHPLKHRVPGVFTLPGYWRAQKYLQRKSIRPFHL